MLLQQFTGYQHAFYQSFDCQLIEWEKDLVTKIDTMESNRHALFACCVIFLYNHPTSFVKSLGQLYNDYVFACYGSQIIYACLKRLTGDSEKNVRVNYQLRN